MLAATNDDIYQGPRSLVDQIDTRDVTEQMQYVDINYYLAEVILKVTVPRCQFRLRLGHQFLDPRIGQFAASIPAAYKLRGRKGKYILKQAVKDLLPPEILSRPKKGFGIPIAEWLKGRLNPLLNDMLAPEP